MAVLVAATLACTAAQVHAQAPANPPASQPLSAAAPDFRRPADLPFRKDEDSGAAVAYGFLLFMATGAAALLWLRRRRGGGAALPWSGLVRPGAEQELKVLGSRPLGAHGSVQVVRWAGKDFLLGCTAQSIHVLDSRAVAEGSVTAPSLRDAGGQVREP